MVRKCNASLMVHKWQRYRYSTITSGLNMRLHWLIGVLMKSLLTLFPWNLHHFKIGILPITNCNVSIFTLHL